MGNTKYTFRGTGFLTAAVPGEVSRGSATGESREKSAMAQTPKYQETTSTTQWMMKQKLQPFINPIEVGPQLDLIPSPASEHKVKEFRSSHGCMFVYFNQ